jgi:hypothetical protein
MHTCDFHCELGTIVCARRYVLDLAQRKHPVDDLSKHNVFAVEEVTFGCGDEELTPVCVRSRVCLYWYQSMSARGQIIQTANH